MKRKSYCRTLGRRVFADMNPLVFVVYSRSMACVARCKLLLSLGSACHPPFGVAPLCQLFCVSSEFVFDQFQSTLNDGS